MLDWTPGLAAQAASPFPNRRTMVRVDDCDGLRPAIRIDRIPVTMATRSGSVVRNGSR